MKPETGNYLTRAREILGQAQAVLHIGYADAAGRAAYLAGFHAAQALIFERDDRVFKTHRGVQGEFARLVKDEPRFDIDCRTFLGRAYNLKAIADYESGPGSKVSQAQATEAIEAARRFVDTIEKLIGV